MTLWDYIQKKEQKKQVFEAFRYNNGDFDYACDLITKYLEKKIDHIKMIKTAEEVEMDGKTLMGMRWVCLRTGANVRICWEFGKTNAAKAYCVDFFSNISDLMNGRGHTSFSIYCNGASVALVLPIIVDVMSTGRLNMRSATLQKLQSATVTESLKLGGMRYRLVKEDTSYAQELYRKKKSLQSKKSINRKFGMDTQDIEYDIAVIDAALNSGSEAVMEETLLSFRRNVPTVTNLSPSLQEVQNRIDQEDHYSNPKTAFKMLEKYLILALKSNRNGVLICGAPGIGKTFRVKRFLSTVINPVTEMPFEWSEDNLVGDIIILKGKVTGAELYKYLWRTKEHGQVLLIDDCDAAITDPVAINLMKAALEGGEDRLITYAIKSKIMDQDPFDPEDELIEVPKNFRYNGKIIILTNLRAGEVDTAIRSRVYIQDINFTVQSLLDIIEEVMPTMNEYTMEGRRKALDYLKKLADDGEPIEISLRTFGTCAGMLSVTEVAEDVELVYEMIKENMRLQSSRGGGRY